MTRNRSDFQAELEPGDPPWVEPLVGLAFEWWFKNKKLTIYNDSMYVAAWGPNIYSQMKYNTLEETSFRTLWTWLYSSEDELKG